MDRVPGRPRPRAGRLLGALALYSALSLLLTWPLAAHFTTHVPGDGIDDPALAWNLWWIKVRLVDQLQPDIFHVGWMFHPVGINLAFYTLTPLNGLLSVPLQTATSLVVANNLLLLSSFVLAGLGAFLLSLEVLGPLVLPGQADRHGFSRQAATAGALVAGLLYAFASTKLFYASLGQFNIASSQWVPFCVLYVWRLGRKLGQGAPAREIGRSGAMAGLFLVLQAWAELTYASFLLIFLALHLAWVLGMGWHARRRTGDGPPMRVTLTRLLAGYAAVAGVFLAGIAPFLAAMVPDLLREGDFFASGGGFADIFSADLMGYLVPTRLHPLFGAWTAQLPFPNDKAQHLYLGYSVLLLAGAGLLWLWRKTGGAGRAAALFWGGSGFVFWLLTLGPHLRWAGQDLPVPGPFALVSRLPFFSGNRYPSRYGVMLLLCAAVLVACGIWWLVQGGLQRPGRANPAAPRRLWAVAAGVGLLILLEHLSLPLPLSDFRTPSIYRQLAAIPGDFAVLELPTGWRNGARVMGYGDDVLLMMQQWYQTTHGKRRLGGNTSRNPPHKFQYFTDAPLLGDLIGLMNAHREHLAPVVESQLEAMIQRNRPRAGQILRDLGIRYVLVHMERATPALLRFVDQALPLTLVDQWQGLDWSGKPATIRLYEVQMPPTEEWAVDLADPAGSIALAEGWSSFVDPGAQGPARRYATRSQPALLFNLPDEGGELTLELFGPATEATVLLNGQPLGPAVLLDPQASTRVTLPIPAGLAREPMDRLTVAFHGPLTPVTALAAAPPDGSGWPIGGTGVSLAPGATVAVRSAGEEVGNFAHIWVNGRDVAQEGRGYHLAALGVDGQVLGTARFDTSCVAELQPGCPPEQSAAMARWLRSWPAGTVIAGAVQDEASLRLDADAVAALAEVGVATDLRGKLRWSHAFIGVVGATPGTALETSSLLRPAGVYVGAAVDGAAVSGGVGRVWFTPPPPG